MQKTRSDGLIEKKIYLGKNADGSLLRKSFYGHSMKEVEEKINEYTRQAVEGYERACQNAKSSISNVVDLNIPELKEILNQYIHISLKGDVRRKRELLLALADKYEPLSKKLKRHEYNSLDNNLGFLLNNMNIRHNNREGQYRNEIAATIEDNELEKWYDKTFKLLLNAFLASDYIDTKSELSELIKRISH